MVVGRMEGGKRERWAEVLGEAYRGKKRLPGQHFQLIVMTKKEITGHIQKANV